MREKVGIFSGISLGTGDPELITVKGLRWLQEASVIAFPAGVGNKSGLAEQIISPWLLPQQHRLALHFPYVQDNDILQKAWLKAAQQVWEYLQKGQDVAFVCEGDISFYSTFNYLAQTLSQIHPEVEIKVVPGVCSPLAAAGVLGIPLTVRSQRLAILPVLYHPQELEQVLAWADVVVLMKVSSVYTQVWQTLDKYHLLDKAWVIERATLPDQVIYENLRNYPNLSLSYFSILIVFK